MKATIIAKIEQQKYIAEEAANNCVLDEYKIMQRARADAFEQAITIVKEVMKE